MPVNDDSSTPEGTPEGTPEEPQGKGWPYPFSFGGGLGLVGALGSDGSVATLFSQGQATRICHEFPEDHEERAQGGCVHCHTLEAGVPGELAFECFPRVLQVLTHPFQGGIPGATSSCQIILDMAIPGTMTPWLLAWSDSLVPIHYCSDMLTSRDQKGWQPYHGNPAPTPEKVTVLTNQERVFHVAAWALFESRREAGVNYEQSRKDLPACTFQRVRWSVSLHTLLHMIRAHTNPGYEHRLIPEAADLVRALGELVADTFPACWQLFCAYQRGPRLTTRDQEALFRLLQLLRGQVSPEAYALALQTACQDFSAAEEEARFRKLFALGAPK